jgi:branched-chain amino acid transport system ATP-binding protein
MALEAAGRIMRQPFAFETPSDALRVEEVSMSFGKFNALKGVSLSVNSGERRAVIGPNGAGKSTLFNTIAGQYRPTSGHIYLNGQETTGFRPDQMWEHGLMRTFQRNQLFLGLTVWANVELACAAHRQTALGIGRMPIGNMDADVADLLARVHLTPLSGAAVKNLAYGEQRQLELALALAGKPKILLLDEPTAGMSPAETEAMLALMSALPRDITLLIVEHDMDVVFTLADTISVLHLGEVLALGTPEEIQNNEQVREVYMGGQGRE